MKRGHIIKATLTPEERLRVAYGHLVLGIDQHAMSALFGVNPARINEAVSAVRAAVEWPTNGGDEE